MRVALIEDHRMMRDLLRRACEREFGCTVVAECDRAAEAAEAVPRTRPDLVILDLQLADGDGLELTEHLRGACSGVRILVLSSRCDPLTVYRVERARVNGFIDKSSQTVELLGAALSAVASGGVYYSPAFRRARECRTADPHSFDKLLTDREQTVFALIGDCLDDREIALRLDISPETAAKHRFNLLRKLGLHTTPELMRRARELGFYTVAPDVGH